MEAHGPRDERDDWTLTVLGQVREPQTLSWTALAELGTVEFATHSHAEDLTRVGRATRFRGPRVDAIIAHAGADPSVEEITYLAFDGFRATVSAEHARRYPLILAQEADGVLIPRDLGGPLYAAYPLDEHPELVARYDGSSWVFYVTHVIVGTEAAAIHVGDHTLDAGALDALPQATLVETVGYRTGWPADAVRLEGPRLRDVLEAGGVAVPERGFVRVVSHAPITQGDTRPTRIAVRDVATQDIILATRYGERREPIPARLGGPVVLALPREVAAHLPEHDWLTFVTHVSVEP